MSQFKSNKQSEFSKRISNAISFNKQTREKLTELFSNNKELFYPVYNISLRAQKHMSQERLKKVLEQGVVSVSNFESDPNNIFSTHEMLSYIDQSMCTKFTVQFNLFGGSVLSLGSDYHRSFINDIDKLKMIGCFCLTEVGYGNNAVEMETTAKLVFDKNSNGKNLLA